MTSQLNVSNRAAAHKARHYDLKMTVERVKSCWKVYDWHNKEFHAPFFALALLDIVVFATKTCELLRKLTENCRLTYSTERVDWLSEHHGNCIWRHSYVTVVMHGFQVYHSHLNFTTLSHIFSTTMITIIYKMNSLAVAEIPRDAICHLVKCCRNVWRIAF